MHKLSLLVISVIFCGCSIGSRNSDRLQNGMWRAILHRSDGMEIPFNFEVKDSLGKTLINIINGKDRMLVDSIRYKGDSVFIHMPFFNSDFLTKKMEDGSLKGEWIKHYPDSNATLGFSAVPGVTYRISPSPAKPGYQVSGQWKTTFIDDDAKDTTAAIGEFHQDGNLMTGTFLTETGDYRYLQGIMDGDTLKLSTFDGSHIYLFKATAVSDTQLINGIFYAGFQGKESWTAVKDSTAKLPDPFAITTYKPGQDKLHFTFPDLHGDSISIDDDRFRNKVVIVQIMGSWCPNCMDETQFLSDWYKKNKSRGIEIIGLCYERSTHFDEAVASAMTFKKRFDVTYPLLITGVTPGDPDNMAKTLPQLQHFISFPTTIFVDRRGHIAKIHAGFSGPGTGKYYQDYISEFNQLVDQLANP